MRLDARGNIRGRSYVPLGSYDLRFTAPLGDQKDRLVSEAAGANFNWLLIRRILDQTRASRAK